MFKAVWQFQIAAEQLYKAFGGSGLHIDEEVFAEDQLNKDLTYTCERAGVFRTIDSVIGEELGAPKRASLTKREFEQKYPYSVWGDELPYYESLMMVERAHKQLE